MNWNIIFTIARKDLDEARQNKSVWMPMLIVPLIFVLVLPLVMILLSSSPDPTLNMASDPDIAVMLKKMPPFMTELFKGLDPKQTSITLMLGYIFAPFFLILPIMFSTVISSESFAGERERKTIEALLYSPASDAELFLGKVLASFIPAVLITWGSFLGYTLVLNIGAYPLMGRIWFPLENWYPLIFWVSPALSLLGITATVLISSKVQTFMGAYQTSASLVIVVLGLMAGQLTGAMYLNATVSWILGIVIWAIDAVLSRSAVRTFNRHQLLASEK